MRKQAILALFLLVPVASFGVTMALWIAPGSSGQIVYSLSKLWLLVFPGVWFFGVEKGKLQFSLPKIREIVAGVGLGIAMFATILSAYFLLGADWIDVEVARTRAQDVGIRSSQIYWAGAAYFSFVNAPIEEYVWRWFVGRQCEQLLPFSGAIGASALLFTLHHIIGLAAYTGWQMVILGSVGVFGAGAIWSWCYFKYRSLWANTIAHILADLAIALVGWQVLFR